MKMADKLRAETGERAEAVRQQRLHCLESLRARRDKVEKLVKGKRRKGRSEAVVPLASVARIVKPDVKSPDNYAVQKAATAFFREEGFKVETQSKIGIVSLKLSWGTS